MCSDVMYICFREAKRERWYLKLLKANFSHCFIIAPDKGKWVKYESGDFVTRVDIVNDYQNYTKDCIIVKINRVKSNKKVFFNTCVGFVKMISGVGGLALTPYQLYKRVK